VLKVTANENKTILVRFVIVFSLFGFFISLFSDQAIVIIT